MRPLQASELVGIDAYEALRDAYRRRVIELKRRRRLAVGDKVTLVFENRETIRFQVQEMMRVERLREPDKVQAELDVYNELVPGDCELSATMLIEIPARERIREELDRLLGIDACVFLVLGGEADELRVRARFDERQLEQDRISAVHYLRFPLGPEAVARLRDPTARARLAIEHPSYRHATALPTELRASLLDDLSGDPPPLLVPPSADDSAARDAAEPAVRVRPGEPSLGRGHVVVESVGERGERPAADAAFEAVLLEVVREQARGLLRRHGACRVVCDLGAAPPAWHVFAPDA